MTLDDLRGTLIVSCQAYPGEPMRTPDTMARVAEAVVRGGASAVRAQGIEDLEEIRRRVTVPLIGLWKDGDEGVYITPTLRHCLAVAATGAEIVALDATRRPRPDGLSLAATIEGLRAEYPDIVVMADCGSAGDAEAAEDAGADLLGTTLAGYTGERPKTDGPDWELIEEMIARAGKPVVVEGRIYTPAQARRAMDLGAFAVVVGTAITHPTTITGWFNAALEH